MKKVADLPDKYNQIEVVKAKKHKEKCFNDLPKLRQSLKGGFKNKEKLNKVNLDEWREYLLTKKLNRKERYSNNKEVENIARSND